MDRAPIGSFIESAADTLTRARGTLLLLAQGGEGIELGPVVATIQDIATVARELELGGLAEKASACSSEIDRADSSLDPYAALDRISEVEAELLDPTFMDESPGDIEL